MIGDHRPPSSLDPHSHTMFERSSFLPTYRVSGDSADPGMHHLPAAGSGTAWM